MSHFPSSDNWVVGVGWLKGHGKQGGQYGAVKHYHYPGEGRLGSIWKSLRDQSGGIVGDNSQGLKLIRVPNGFWRATRPVVFPGRRSDSEAVQSRAQSVAGRIACEYAVGN